jgi:glycosyltransferase involved in cell wall biosynthesis
LHKTGHRQWGYVGGVNEWLTTRDAATAVATRQRIEPGTLLDKRRPLQVRSSSRPAPRKEACHVRAAKLLLHVRRQTPLGTTHRPNRQSSGLLLRRQQVLLVLGTELIALFVVQANGSLRTLDRRQCARLGWRKSSRYSLDMRIAFFDPTGWAYTADTPYERPLGGAHSATCYLAAELALLGHDVTIFNGDEESSSRGVAIANLREANNRRLAGCDVCVVLNGAMGKQIRREYRFDGCLILWAHHFVNEQAVAPLNGLLERKSWTAFAFVSEWQRLPYEQAFGLRPRKCMVMRNAISPAFQDLPGTQPWFVTDEPPVLVYTSTPFRGLGVLLDSFPSIREAVPGTRLRIFSSMGVYLVKPEQDSYRQLYRRAAAMEGVEYVGSIGQRELAAEINGAAALAYPSTFKETSCISVMEAMAAGAAIFSTRLGAIPETSGGYASLIDWHEDQGVLAKDFATMAIDTLRGMRRSPDAAAQSRTARVRFARDTCTWQVRAREWDAWLTELLRDSGKQTSRMLE